MLTAPNETGLVRIVFHNDDETPLGFVVELLRGVFGQSEADALAFAGTVDGEGRAGFGAFAPDEARALLTVAEQRIKAREHPLRLSVEPVEVPVLDESCYFCGAPKRAQQTLFKGPARADLRRLPAAWRAASLRSAARQDFQAWP